MKFRNLPFWIVSFIVFCSALYYRSVGFDWDQGQLLHPDERFLVMVEGATELPKSLRDYFDTVNSSINPHNRGHGFYVYGTLPIIIVRVLVELVPGVREVPLHLVGRAMSFAADIGTLLLTFASALLLFERRTALLALCFVSWSALHIQHAHFGVVESLLTFLCACAVFIAILIERGRGRQTLAPTLALAFGCAVGLAASTKIIAILLAPLLILAIIRSWNGWLQSLVMLILAGAGFLIMFRLFQPYAFLGPSPFSLEFNPRWLANLAELKRLSVPSLGFPPAVQWVNRSIIYGPYNMVVWGLGLPLGLVAVLSWIFAGRELLSGRNLALLIPAAWVSIALVFFALLPANPTLRYALPAYPYIFLVCAWFVQHIFSLRRELELPSRAKKLQAPLRLACAAILPFSLIGSLAWGHAFSRIYTRPHSRISASEWILDHVPSTVTVRGRGADGIKQIFIQSSNGAALSSSSPLRMVIRVPSRFFIKEILIPKPRFLAYGAERETELSVEIDQQFRRDCLNPAASVRISEPLQPLSLPLVCVIESEGEVGLTLRLSGENTLLAFEPVRIAHETSWDDGLPLRVRGLDPYGGIYKGDLNLEMYWQDNDEKQTRLNSVMQSADYLFMSSNRQWGSIGRLEKLFPISAQFYRSLVECEPQFSIPECFASGEERIGSQGRGFTLKHVEKSFPNLGTLEFNTQFADEAFSVYDHPMVHIFASQRLAEPRIGQAREIHLSAESTHHQAPIPSSGSEEAQ